MTAIVEYCLLVAVFIGCLFKDVRSLHIVTYSPNHQRIQAIDDVANFFCNGNAAIDKCQFKIWDGYNNKELQLFIGNSLTNDWLEGSSGTFSVRKYKLDLKKGRCGMTLRGKYPNGQYLVGCRITRPGEDWFYRYSTLYVTPNKGNETIDLQSVPEYDVYAPSGTDLNITCSTTLPNRECNFRPGPGLTAWTNQEAHTCGTTIHVNDENSGMIWCRETNGGNIYNLIDIRGTTVASYKPPSKHPELSLVVMRFDENYTIVSNVGSTNRYKEGDVLTATCTVMESRPPSNITWFVGFEVAGTNDAIEQVEDDNWRWTWTAVGTQQILRRNLTEEDTKTIMRVACEANHVSLGGPLRTEQAIDLRDLPADTSNLVIFIAVGVGVSLVVVFVIILFTYNFKKLPRADTMPQ